MDRYEYIDKCNIRGKVILKLLSIYFSWLSFLVGLGLLLIGLMFEVYYYLGITAGLWISGVVTVNLAYRFINHYKCLISDGTFILYKSKGYSKFIPITEISVDNIASVCIGEIGKNKYYNGNGEVFTLRTRDGREYTLCADTYMLALLKGSIK